MAIADTTESIDRLFEAGAHFAQLKSRRHPSMKSFIVGSKAKVEIFDLQKTMVQLDAARGAMETFARDGRTVLFVGGKQEIADTVRSVAERINTPYVAGRWLGGTISNFVEIKKRIDRLAELTSERESGEFEKRYTKLERIHLDREITRLTTRLEGIRSLSKKPDVFVVVDTRHEAHAVREAMRAGIPVIGIMNSDCRLSDATYPIVTNDASRTTVTMILDELVVAYEKGRKG